MLRLYDARTRRVEQIRPGHAGELRVLAVTPGGGAEPDLGEARGWLLPDLISRYAERRGLAATVCEIIGPAAGPGPAVNSGPGPAPGSAATGPVGSPGGERGRVGAAAAPEAARSLAVRAMLNVHPPARTAPAGEPVERSAEFVSPGWAGTTPGKVPPFDIGTGDTGWLAGRQLTRYLTAPPGAVTVDGRKAGADGVRVPSVAEVAARGLDPLAARLIFLGRRYRDDLDLSWEGLFAAGKTLLRWREHVAAWALSPSAPIARRYADAISAAFEDDLDIPAALGELHALEGDAGVPDGAKFETFAAMDRLFGLDLVRDVGR
ncbi:MAG TPA: hypothetical protein VE733_17405 [Streptosporangiaceae bacterium]|nr:hypothetical protein [Streptosporangiaceae bacterium]